MQDLELWFVTGSQHLYGEEALNSVAADARQVAGYLNDASYLPLSIIFKPVVTRPEEIGRLCIEANASPQCIGLICWMHTFSPAKMWINGLKILHKPLLHLHTQFGRDIPWATIDMDYMNLHQSAHGGREFGFIGSRMRIDRKVVVGHWQDPAVVRDLDVWARAACGNHEMQHLRVARLGDNMREVAVTEGDKVAAQIQFGYSVNGYGMGDLAEYLEQVDPKAVSQQVVAYEDAYEMAPALRADGAQRSALLEAAKIELGLRAFLEAGQFNAFTDTFENLHGLPQLPGIAVQRLMADGYGFGAEGDWKTAALVRTMKVMAQGLKGGNSFMEDYTYHFDPAGQQVLGAHMLEICPSITNEKPKCEIHPLGIGGKADPVRLVFDAAPGPALNASVIDLGARFRMVVNVVETIESDQSLPRLPVARALWKAKPDLRTAAACWILAGGAHHTCYSQNLSVDHLNDLAEMTGMELMVIDEETKLRRFKQELQWGAAYYGS